MDENTFKSYSLKVTGLKVAILAAMLVLAIYSIVVGSFIRTKEFFLYGVIVVSSSIVVIHYLFPNDPNFILPDNEAFGFKEYQLFSIVQNIALMLFLDNKARFNKYSSNLLRPNIYISFAAIPLTVILPVTQGAFLFYVISIPITLIVTIFMARGKLYTEMAAYVFYVGGNIMGVVSLLVPYAPTFLYWSTPVGSALFNFILLNGFIFDAHKKYQSKKENLERKNRHEFNLELANELQNKFMAPEDHSNIATYYRPAERIGGDWYQYFYSSNRDLIHFFIGDVTDHGMKSAYMTALVAGGMKEIKRRFSRLEEISHEELRTSAMYFNDLFYFEGSKHSLSMTFLAASLDLRTGELALINICHPNPILLDGAELRPLVASGPYLALEESIDVRVATFNIKPSQRIFFYTDGLVENGYDGKTIKLRDIKAALKCGCNPSEICISLEQLMDERWQKYIEDDVTFMIFQMPPHKNTNAA